MPWKEDLAQKDHSSSHGDNVTISGFEESIVRNFRSVRSILATGRLEVVHFQKTRRNPHVVDGVGHAKGVVLLR